VKLRDAEASSFHCGFFPFHYSSLKGMEWLNSLHLAAIMSDSSRIKKLRCLQAASATVFSKAEQKAIFLLITQLATYWKK